MKYHHFFTLIAVLCAALNAKAQSNFKTGYVVNLKGDTSVGFIDYQEWIHNPGSVQFKPAILAGSLKITPQLYQSFGIYGSAYYERYSGPITTDPRALDKISLRDTSTKSVAVFLKTLQRGKNITLYKYTDNIKERYFFKETRGNSMPKELVSHLYLKNNTAVDDNEFVVQLFNEASKFNLHDEKAIDKLQKTEYTENGLLETISYINNDAQSKINIGSGHWSARPFIGAGINLATFTTNVNTLSPTVTSSYPLLTLGVDLPANPETGKLIFRLQGIATQNKYYSNANILTYTFTQTEISLLLQIVYNLYNSQNFKFYVAPGFAINSLMYSKESYYQTISDKQYPYTPFFPYRDFTINAVARVGITLANKIDISGSYQPPQIITNGDNRNIKLSNVHVELSYCFGK